MGLFTKNKSLEVFSPVDGEVISISDVEDEVFSEKMLGDGLAIIPSNGSFYAPIEGKLVTVFPSGHAYGILAKNGVEILLHIGIDTVSLDGEGFDIKVKQNDSVQVGDLLAIVDIENVSKKVPSIQTPLIFTTESMDGKKIEILKTGKVNKGDLIAVVK
ncbi:PTS sugar transporter subunit IIA [Spiroplasma turonicum]|uniref:PTS system glucose-specific IIA component n=1 Tax=Spiroplasma turonicum TaxID=216946 RepID=A0A0K1P5A2_9MOLU|nr:PTS glucose transporter subunit IIA [Spiroplasma turonicum]AKU79349.1 PTS system glucose-specific IIA component [Spiroplasma turonicum]ALX70370.1 PTS system, glucose-specific IIA component [Spiroplasma turonicum]